MIFITYTHKDKLVMESDRKPHLCDLCSKIFTDKETLPSHKEQHGFIEQRKSEKSPPQKCTKKTWSRNQQCVV